MFHSAFCHPWGIAMNSWLGARLGRYSQARIAAGLFLRVSVDTTSQQRTHDAKHRRKEIALAVSDEAATGGTHLAHPKDLGLPCL